MTVITQWEESIAESLLKTMSTAPTEKIPYDLLNVVAIAGHVILKLLGPLYTVPCVETTDAPLPKRWVSQLLEGLGALQLVPEARIEGPVRLLKLASQ